MNKSFQNRLSTLESCIKVQRNCIHPSDSSHDYMHGMLNGLILAHSCITDSAPDFQQSYKRKTTNIRHKAKNDRRR